MQLYPVSQKLTDRSGAFPNVESFHFEGYLMDNEVYLSGLYHPSRITIVKADLVAQTAPSEGDSTFLLWNDDNDDLQSATITLLDGSKYSTSALKVEVQPEATLNFRCLESNGVAALTLILYYTYAVVL